jgi:hypothetical protein
VAKPADFIDAAALEEALKGHADRMALHGPKPISRIIASLRVDADGFQAASKVLVEHRHGAGKDVGPYTAGVVDGFVVGVLAARAAASASQGER